jgi:hypothetical protein
MLAFFVFALLLGIPGQRSFAIGFYSGLLLPWLTVIWLAICAIFAYRQHWRGLLSIAVIPFVVLLLQQPIVTCSDYIHLLIYESTYAKEIAAGGMPEGERFAAFDWSIGFAGSNNRFVIFDESDGIASARLVQSKALTQSGFAESCAGKVRHIRGHYYLCEL